MSGGKDGMNSRIENYLKANMKEQQDFWDGKKHFVIY